MFGGQKFDFYSKICRSTDKSQKNSFDITGKQTPTLSLNQSWGHQLSL